MYSIYIYIYVYPGRFARANPVCSPRPADPGTQGSAEGVISLRGDMSLLSVSVCSSIPYIP